MKIVSNKKGSVSIFMMVTLLSMVLVIGFFMEAASSVACRSFGEGVLSLAAESLLTEYQRTLKKDYGLFAFLGEKQTMEGKMAMYTLETFNKGNQKGGGKYFEGDKQMDLLRLKLNQTAIDLEDFSITRMEIFEAEIKKYMLYKGGALAAEKVINQSNVLEEIKKGENLVNNQQNEMSNMETSLTVAESSANSGDSMDGQKAEVAENAEKVKQGKKKLNEIKKRTEREAESETGIVEESQIIKNERVIHYLPSQILKGDESGSSFQSPQDLFVVSQYILNTFYDATTENRKRDGFYRYETEYIINGNLDDSKNLNAVKQRLMVMRLGLNMGHIYSSPTKLKQVAAAATALTPGPWAAVTQLVLVGIWSAAEGTNDIKLLMAGKKVPLIKQDSNWAVDLQTILSGGVGGGAVGAGDKGLDYAGYLGILLTVNGKRDNLLRSMDLIQINIKGTDDKTFMLQNYYVGFSYKAKIEKESGFFSLMGKGFRLGDLEGEIRY